MHAECLEDDRISVGEVSEKEKIHELISQRG